MESAGLFSTDCLLHTAPCTPAAPAAVSSSQPYPLIHSPSLLRALEAEIEGSCLKGVDSCNLRYCVKEREHLRLTHGVGCGALALQALAQCASERREVLPLEQL